MDLMRRWVAAFAVAILLLNSLPAAIALAEDSGRMQDAGPGELYGASALLIDANTGAVIFEKDANTRRYPASTTKIMTLLLALESDIPLDEVITVPKEAGNIPDGSSSMGIKPGDMLTFEDLLYGFMLSSGNDGANAIAVLVSSSIDAFVQMMNAKALEMGCMETHFVNAHGYHDPNHYTTAADLAIMAKVAMENEDFRRIVACGNRQVTLKRGERTGVFDVESRNTLLLSGQKYYYADCTGIKTGHTNKAGWCFVGSASRDGIDLICVTLKCDEEMQKWDDAVKLFEYGFSQYTEVTAQTLLKTGESQRRSVSIENASENDLPGGVLKAEIDSVESEWSVQMPRQDVAGLKNAAEALWQSAEITWTHSLMAPISRGEQLGILNAVAPDGSHISALLVSPVDVAPAVAPDEYEPVQAEKAYSDPWMPASVDEISEGKPDASSGDTNPGISPWVFLGIAALAAAATLLVLLMQAAQKKKRRMKRHGHGRAASHISRDGNRRSSTSAARSAASGSNTQPNRTGDAAHRPEGKRTATSGQARHIKKQ